MGDVQIHYPAVLAAAALGFVIGGLWYSPIGFAKAWMQASGISEAQTRQASMGKIFGFAALAQLVIAINLAAFIGPKGDVAFGLFAGFAAGLGWVAMSLGVIYLFEQRPLKLWLINSGYQVGAIAGTAAAVGAILAPFIAGQIADRVFSAERYLFVAMLAGGALQFVLAHPAITTVLLGPRTVAELDANLAAIEVAIPDALWTDLAKEGYIAPDSPRPAASAANPRAVH